MKSKLTILFACVLILGLTACQSSSRRQIVSARVLQTGTVPGSSNKPDAPPVQHRVQLWSSDNPQRGCDVTVSYHGNEQTEAYLEYVSPADSPRPAESLLTAPPDASKTNGPIVWPLPESPNPYISRRVGAKGASIVLQNVTEVRLVCGDYAHSSGGDCAYTIDEIDCSRSTSQVYTTRLKGDSLARAVEPCCTGRKVLWIAPVVGGKTNVCNVTALLHGSKLCPARVWSFDALGQTANYQFAGDQPTFVTFRDSARIEFECGSPIDKGGGQCVLEILQTECDR